MDRKIQVETKLGLYFSIIIVSFLAASVLSIEENQAAIYLSPRNFNPHPYEAGYVSRDSANVNNVGPIVFPPSLTEEDITVDSDVFITGREHQSNHPVDDHPYPKVASKRKYQNPQRFRYESNAINPRVYEALSNHAAKVLSEPVSQLRKDYTFSSLSNKRKNYAFSYKVVDHFTGDDFSHTQSRDSGATNGEYRVKLPDGRVQIVSYIADKNGYKADVKYTENDLSESNLQIQHIPDSGKRKIRPIPILRANSYDYRYDHISGSHLPTQLPAYDRDRVLYIPLPTTPPSTDYRDYNIFTETATPKPTNEPESSNAHFSSPQTPPRPKVEIYSDDNEINGLNNYVGSTLAPYLYGNAEGYQEDVVASTVTPTLGGYPSRYTVY